MFLMILDFALCIIWLPVRWFHHFSVCMIADEAFKFTDSSSQDIWVSNAEGSFHRTVLVLGPARVAS